MQLIIDELCTELVRSDRESTSGTKVLIKEKTFKCRPYTPLTVHLSGPGRSLHWSPHCAMLDACCNDC